MLIFFVVTNLFSVLVLKVICLIFLVFANCIVQLSLQSKLTSKDIYKFLHFTGAPETFMMTFCWSFLWSRHISVLLLLTTKPKSLNHLPNISSSFSKFRIKFESILFKRTTKLSTVKLVIWVKSKRVGTKIAYRTGPRTDPWIVPVSDF